MKYFLIVTVLLLRADAFGQKLSIKLTVAHIDSVVLANQQKKKCSVIDCDTMTDIKGATSYRCWNFYYGDTSRKEICECNVSFSGRGVLYYFFENQKLVKVQRNFISQGRIKHTWRLYLNEGREIYCSGKSDGMGWNYVEDAAHFREIGLEYPSEGKCHLKVSGSLPADGKQLEHHISK